MAGSPTTRARTFVWCRPLIHTALVVLFVVGFACLQTASASVVHPHEHGGNDCPICQVGHIPSLGAMAAIAFLPPVIAEWPLWRDTGAAPGFFTPAFNPSRAPPA
ncbi:MAG: hypothetical protein ABSG25_06545 [Bryobacteraceae bacterium]